MPTATRRQFTDAFTSEAVRLTRESGRPGAQAVRAEQNELTRLKWEHEMLRKERDASEGTRWLTTCGGVLREEILMRYRGIYAQDRRDPIRPMCRPLAVSAAGSDAWRSRPERTRSASTRTLLSASRVIHRASRETYGSPSIWDALIK